MLWNASVGVFSCLNGLGDSTGVAAWWLRNVLGMSIMLLLCYSAMLAKFSPIMLLQLCYRFIHNWLRHLATVMWLVSWLSIAPITNNTCIIHCTFRQIRRLQRYVWRHQWIIVIAKATLLRVLSTMSGRLCYSAALLLSLQSLNLYYSHWVTRSFASKGVQFTLKLCIHGGR